VSAVTVGGIGAIAACQPPASASDNDSDGDEEVATPVVVTEVKSGAIEATIEAASTIEPERMVIVPAESTGRITVLPVEEGDAIEAGALVAKIKQGVQRTGLDRAATGLASAKQDLTVVKKLFEAGAASSDELRAAQLALDTAKLDLRDRKRDVANTRVTAPMGGTVTERFVTQGAYVSAGAQLATIVDFSSLVARVYVPERELDRIAVGQPAEIVGKAAQERKGQGKVLRIAPVVDATTGTVKVTIALPEALAGGKGFLPGMFAEVTLVTQRRENAVLVDKQTLVYRDEKPFVFVVEGDKAHERALEVGLADERHVEVLKGLSLGDKVVRSGQAGLQDAALIRLVDASGKPLDGENADSDKAGEQPEGEGKSDGAKVPDGAVAQGKASEGA